jgi:predicted nucleic acid-binding Zn ribbon protein
MRRIRKNMDKPASLGTVLRQAIEASRIDVDLDAYRLWQQWEDVVGPMIAQNTQPEAIKGRLLLVHVSSAPWMQQLQFLKPELIQKLNEIFGKEVVTDIRFKIGPVYRDP